MTKVLVVKENKEIDNDKLIFFSLLHPVICLDESIAPKVAATDKDLLITSKNGVAALLQNMSIVETSNIKEKCIFTVGSKTYDLLKSEGFCNLARPTYDMQSLLPIIAGKKVLYLSGYHTAFQDYHQYEVERLIVYKTLAKNLTTEIRTFLEKGMISHVMLYSRRTAELFLKNFSDDRCLKKTTFICISEAVAGRLERFKVLYPARPTEDEMFSLLNADCSQG